MIKLSAGYVPERQAHVIVFGLEEGNLIKLRDGKPIIVKSDDLDIPAPGFDVAIFFGRDREAIKAHVTELLETHVQDDARVTVMHMGGKFYLVPFSNSTGRNLYLVGLDETSCRFLRNGEIITFRSRQVHDGAGGVGVNAEVLIYWGHSQETLEEELYASGLLTRETKVRRF